MTPKSNLSRADFVRQRRTTQQHSKTTSHRMTKTASQLYRSEMMYLPLELRKMARHAPSHTVKNTSRKSYDIAFSLGHTDVRAPAPTLGIPRLGARWISAALTLLFGFLLYTLWTAPVFTVEAANVTGNQRLSEVEVSAMIGMIGQPIFKAVPTRIEANLRAAFPDLASVEVSVGLPNHVNIAVVERTPVLAWYQDGVMTWIDANGIAFKPRGEVEGLIQIAASSTPLATQISSTGGVEEQAFIDPSVVKAMVTLYPYVPSGAPMIYDPQYGMGWQDPRGWSVYFGQNAQDISTKLEVYQSIIDKVNSQGIQPTLISVAYLDAPFYK